MERLTKLSGIGEHELCACYGCYSGENNEKCGLCMHNVLAIDMLGCYEDTSLTPDEIMKLKKNK